MKAKPAELLLSLAVLALGVSVALGAMQMSGAGGYARVGPNVAPAAIAVGLILMGAWLCYEALSGGWRNAPPDDAATRGEHPFQLGAFVWVSLGLVAQILLIHTAGFVLAQAALFACVARAFGSTRLVRDLAIGILLGLAVFLFFVKFLNVSLPAGWLEPILGGAGI
ncbi:MAG TPA: tripartite tricarboxylate transporter TctB family protein [Candidatus Limnocylindria bacterium]|nr:tripartite tricarboxylate transporter TctB family protein [Candidatus Limnocylindria bacterium]